MTKTNSSHVPRRSFLVHLTAGLVAPGLTACGGGGTSGSGESAVDDAELSAALEDLQNRLQVDWAEAQARFRDVEVQPGLTALSNALDRLTTEQGKFVLAETTAALQLTLLGLSREVTGIKSSPLLTGELSTSIEAVKNKAQDLEVLLASQTRERTAMAAQLSQVERGFGTLREQLDGAVAGLTQTGGTLESIDEQVNDPVNGLAALRQKLASGVPANLSTTLDDLAAGVNQLRPRVDSLSGNLGGESARISAAQVRLDNVDASLKTLADADVRTEGGVAANAAAVTELRGALAAAETALRALTTELGTQVSTERARLTTLAQSVATMQERLATQEAGLTSLTGVVADLRRDLQTLQTQVPAGLSATLAQLRTDITGLQEQLATLQTQLEALRATVDTKASAADVIDLQDGVGVIRTELRALQLALDGKAANSELQTVRADLVTLQATLGSLQTEVAGKASVADVETLRTDLAGLRTSLAELDARQVAQGVRIDVTDAAWREQVARVQTAATTLQDRVTAVESALDGKASVDQVTTLATTLSATETTLRGLISALDTRIVQEQARIDALETSVEASVASLRRWINALDHGVVADGVVDDTAAMQRCIDAALVSGSAIYLPAGTYRITGKLVCFLWSAGVGRRSVQFFGAGQIGGAGGTRIVFEAASANSVCFEHAEMFCMSNVRIVGVPPSGQTHGGIAFSTQLNMQSSFSLISGVSVTGAFKYSFYRRFSIYDRYERINSRGSLCHFMFSLNPSHDDPLSTNSIAGWNGGATGWFHNQLTFDNVLCSGGELGIGGGLMGANFVQVSCEGQSDGIGTNNQILPIGEPGTGIWLRGNTPTDVCRGNTIGTFYSENTHRPFKLQNSGPVVINSAFVQGVFLPDVPVAPVFLLDNAVLNLLSLTVRARFTHLIRAQGTSRAIVQLVDGGGFTVRTHDVSANSSVLDLMDLELSRAFQLTRAGGVAAESIDLIPAAAGRNYLIRVAGSANGSFVDSTYLLAGSVLSYSAAMDHSSTDGSFAAVSGFRGLQLSVVASRLRISRVAVSGAMFGCDVHIFITPTTLAVI